MPRYMIEASHEAADCLRLLDEFLHAGAHYLTRTEWGCKDGVHTAWMVVEAEDAQAARLLVPPILRTKVAPIKLNFFTPAQIEDYHKAEGGSHEEKMG